MNYYSFLNEEFSDAMLDCMLSDDIQGMRDLISLSFIGQKNKLSSLNKKEIDSAHKFVEKYLLNPWLENNDSGYSDGVVIELLRMVKFSTEDCLVLLYESNTINGYPLFKYLSDNDFILKNPDIDVSTILSISASMEGGSAFVAHVLSRVKERLKIDSNPHLITIVDRVAKKLSTSASLLYEVSKLEGGVSEIDAWMKNTLQRSPSHSLTLDDLLLLHCQGFKKTAEMHAKTFNHSFTGNQLLIAEKILGLDVSSERLTKMFSTGSKPKFAAALNYIFIKSTDHEFSRHINENTLFRDAQDFSDYIVKTVRSYEISGIDYESKHMANRIDATLNHIDSLPGSNFKLKSDHQLIHARLTKLPSAIIQESNRLKRMLLSEDLGM